MRAWDGPVARVLPEGGADFGMTTHWLAAPAASFHTPQPLEIEACRLRQHFAPRQVEEFLSLDHPLHW